MKRKADLEADLQCMSYSLTAILYAPLPFSTKNSIFIIFIKHNPLMLVLINTKMHKNGHMHINTILYNQ
jgi:hypothetical protein